MVACEGTTSKAWDTAMVESREITWIIVYPF